ncbi:MAG: hypothetical protein A4E57_02310 [Syntrophorhabdaceae bacterium PtaU1.Bin034]|nr:MAG: hypothetical protein A4E57_02310 [Syntrophorhabdaceae bacterium PtaU1.Bin034]
MTTKRSGASEGGKKKGEDKAEKQFRAAIANVEKIAQERILSAHDPFSVAVKMAKEIRSLYERIEKEADSCNPTEASLPYDDGGGVGIGVM